uniref:Uncharacterized protein n=1 Tax=Utricularia reniformis TaxID=192314 RepID=A0A1Y0B2R4_9LAMI|nr:hypothetical protein AEK19_MT1499 [Utricularia reniformis]ART31690.1 hypothetical protein AEK19_MT1499 [Utricularia reniformis]
MMLQILTPNKVSLVLKWPEIELYNGAECITKRNRISSKKEADLGATMKKTRCISELYSPWESTMSYLSNYSSAV